jgi:hypothetical protein
VIKKHKTPKKMDKSKWMAAGVTMAIVVIGSIVAAIIINKVQAVKNLTTK